MRLWYINLQSSDLADETYYFYDWKTSIERWKQKRDMKLQIVWIESLYSHVFKTNNSFLFGSSILFFVSQRHLFTLWQTTCNVAYQCSSKSLLPSMSDVTGVILNHTTGVTNILKTRRRVIYFIFKRLFYQIFTTFVWDEVANIRVWGNCFTGTILHKM